MKNKGSQEVAKWMTPWVGAGFTLPSMMQTRHGTYGAHFCKCQLLISKPRNEIKCILNIYAQINQDWLQGYKYDVVKLFSWCVLHAPLSRLVSACLVGVALAHCNGRATCLQLSHKWNSADWVAFLTWLLTFRSCLTNKSKTTRQLKFGQENILRNMDEFYEICSLFAFTFKWLLAELVRTGCVMLQNKNPSTRCLSCPWCISNTGQWVWRNNLSHTAPQELTRMGAMNCNISKFAQPSGILGPVSSGITEKTNSGLVWGLGLLN